MPPFAGLHRKTKRGPRTRDVSPAPSSPPSPSPPPLPRPRQIDSEQRQHPPRHSQATEALPSRKRAHPDNGSDDDSPPPSSSPPPRRSKPTFSRRIIASYEALDHKAQEPTRKKLGFQQLYEAARYLPRLVTQVADYDTILLQGLVREFAHEDPEVERGVAVERTEELDRMLYNSYWESHLCYPIIKGFFPGFKEHTSYLRRHPDLVRQMATFMRAVARKARSDDANRLKEVILKLHPSFTAAERETLHKPKTRRGFNHPKTGRLLCPISLVAKYDDDPERFCREVRERHKNGIRIYSTDWPVALYDEDLYWAGYDPDDPDDGTPGFMRSQILLDSYRVIFTGMASTSITDSAPGGKIKGKPPISATYNVREVTAQSLCYVASLVRFALNSQGEWDDNDGDFHGRKFVSAAFTIMLRRKDFTNELLTWWNDQIFGDASSDTEEKPDTDTAFTRMLARDDAKRATAKAKGKQVASSNITGIENL